MKLQIDRDADALYLRLDENPIVESEEVAAGVILDLDAKNTVVGVEILNLSKRVSLPDLNKMTVETVGQAA